MSVIVKDMRMPVSCLSCDFCNVSVLPPFCMRLMRNTEKGCRRLPDCPLEEITEGGDA